MCFGAGGYIGPANPERLVEVQKVYPCCFLHLKRALLVPLIAPICGFSSREIKMKVTQSQWRWTEVTYFHQS